MELSRGMLTSVEKRDALLHQVLHPTRNNTLPTPSHSPARAMDVTQISPPSASRHVSSAMSVSTTCQRLKWRSSSFLISNTSLQAIRYAPQSTSRAISTAVEVEPKLRVFPQYSEPWTTTDPVAGSSSGDVLVTSALSDSTHASHTAPDPDYRWTST